MKVPSGYRLLRPVAFVFAFLVILWLLLFSRARFSTENVADERPAAPKSIPHLETTGTVAITDKSPADSEGSTTVDQASGSARFVAAPLDLEPIRQAAERYEETGVYRFAHGIGVSLTPANAGTWSDGANGQRIWRSSVSSPGAVSLNLGFERYAMPEGGTLTIRSAEDDAGSGTRVFTARDNEEHGQLWTPLFEGDEVDLEVRVPASREKELDLLLTRVNHGFRAAERSLKQAGDSASDGCHIDVACSAETLPGIGHLVDAYRDQIRSVGAFTLNGVETCTGALINNTANDRRPFFLTARHCGITAGNAPSMVVYWNFESSACRTPGCCGNDTPAGGRLDQFNTGAILRASYAPSDVALVELDDPVDPEADPFFAGWDRSGAQSASSAGIHHPALSEKRISFSFTTTTTTSWGQDTGPGDGSHARVLWTHGVTEPGSSGSPLFDAAGRIIGQLHGGTSECYKSLPDWYGRISRSWEGGGTPGTRLRDWLDPANTGVTTLDGADAAPLLTIRDVSVVEGPAGLSNAVFTVELSPMATSTVTVQYTTVDLSASAPSDYTASSGTLTFEAGVAEGQVVVPVLGDTIPEEDEQFLVELSSPTGAGLFRSVATGTIRNDDYLPPEIDSPLSVTGFVNRPFSYQITAERTARQFSLGPGAPPGMAIHPGTGRIRWIPDAPGAVQVTIIASNGGGTDSETLAIDVTYGVVDLSTHLPPVADQGSSNWSSAWAVAYYYKSFQEARERGWSLADPTHQFSPTFLLNQSNSAPFDVQPYLWEMLDLVAERGAAPLSLAPYTPSDRDTWPTYEAGVAALPYRSAGYAYLGTGSDSEIIDAIRNRLEGGDLALIEFPFYRESANVPGTFETLSGGSAEFDLPAPREVLYEGLEAVTLVGYDDSRFGGRGGFRVVNSRGSGWGDGGFAWISYDFVRLFGLNAYVMDDRIGYEARAWARVKFSHSYFYSDSVEVELGVGDTTVPIWSKVLGSRESLLRDSISADMVVDLTDEGIEWLPATTEQKWWVKLDDQRSEDAGMVSIFDLSFNGVTVSAAQSLPVNGSAGLGATLWVSLPIGESPSENYYVNDLFVAGDQYTSAPGDDENDGLTSASPKASIQDVIDTYRLKPGDTVWVDTGIYFPEVNTRIDQFDDGEDGLPVRIVGVMLSNGEIGSVIDSGTQAGRVGFLLEDGGRNVLLENLWFKRGDYGVDLNQHWLLNTRGSRLENVRIEGSAQSAIRLYESEVTMDNCLIDGTGTLSAAVQINRSSAILARSTIVSGDRKNAFSLVSGSISTNAYLSLFDSIVFGASVSSSTTGLVSLGSYSYVQGLEGNLFFGEGGRPVGIPYDSSNLVADPLFANRSNRDYHLRSASGRWGPDENAGAGGFVADLVTSPGVDLGRWTEPVGQELDPNGDRLNVGAYAGTAFASKSPQVLRHLTLDSPAASSKNLTAVIVGWTARGDGWLPGETVRIEYSSDGGENWTLATGAGGIPVVVGQFVWDSTGIPGGANYMIRVVANADPEIAGIGGGPFTIHHPVTYYVNDVSTADDEYCSAAGSVGNDGLSPAAPKASVQAILDTYDLEGGDVIYVDRGNYLLGATLTVGSADGGDPDHPVRIVGASDWGSTVLDRNSTSSGVVNLAGASHVWLEDLWITRGNTGVAMGNGCQIKRCRVYKNSGSWGLGISSKNTGVRRISNCLIDHNGTYGIEIYDSDGVELFNNTIAGHTAYEVYASTSANDLRLVNNIVWSDGGANRRSVYITSNASLQTSNYNCLLATSGSTVGHYLGTTLTTLSDWKIATGKDTNSLSTDPLFVDADGADNVAGNADDDFHLRSTGGSWRVGGFVADALDSPAIDAGDPATPVGLESTPNGNRINLGAFGGAAHASRTSAGRVLTLISPNGGEVLAGTSEIRWAVGGLGWSPGDTVRLEYSLNNGTTWQVMVGAGSLAYGLGTFAWDISSLGSSAVTRVRVVSNEDGLVVDGSDGYHVLHNGPIFYYVNDASTSGDEYCSAEGSSGNDGLSPASPKDSVQAVLNAYNLEGGDVIYVDRGTYLLGATLTVGTADRGDATVPVRIVGASEWGATVLNRNNLGSTAVDLTGASNVWLENLWITRGDTGVAMGSGCQIQHCRVYKNSGYGVELSSIVSYSRRVANSLIDRNGSYGIILRGDGSEVVNNTILGHSSYEVFVTSNADDHQLRNNIIWSDGNPSRRAIYVVSGRLLAASDHNNLIATNGSAVGEFSNAVRMTLSDWQAATGKDGNSLSVDPLFVDADGVDNIAGNADDDFHLQSTAGSWRIGGFVADALDSPAIDAGDPSTPAGLESAPNGNRINLGAFGGTAHASQTSAGRVLTLVSPNGGEVRQGSSEIRWATGGQGWVGGDTVRLEYSLNNGTTWQVMVGAGSLAYGLGTFAWDISSLGSSAVTRVRVVSNEDGLVVDGSDGYHVLHNEPNSYYVNDGSTGGDEYCSAAGSAGNDGLSPATPKDSVQAILDAYDLEGGDVIYVDRGNYLLGATLTVGAADEGDGTAPVRIVGANAWGATVLDRNNAATDAVDLSGANVWLENLWITRGGTGVDMGDGCRLSHCRLFKNFSIGVSVDTTNTGVPRVENCLIDRNGSNGVYLYDSDRVELVNNTVFGHSTYEIYAGYSTGELSLTNNIVWSDGNTNRRAVYMASTASLDKSNHNNLIATNGAAVGYFSNAVRPTLSDWKTATGKDTNSLSTDPLFVDADGADNVAGNGDDDFHLQSTAGSWRPGGFVPDALDSPAIDAGDPAAPVGLENAPNGNRINLGAFGGTVHASRTYIGRRLTLVSHLSGITAKRELTIRWLAEGNAWLPGETVSLSYTTDGGTTWTPITGAQGLFADSGQFNWNLIGVPHGGNYSVRIVGEQSPTVEVGSGIFSIAGVYFINDAVLADDQYATAPGNDSNDGMSPSAPKATLQALLAQHDIEPGDTVFIDSGVYPLAADPVLEVVDSGSSNGRVSIVGVPGETIFEGTGRNYCLSIRGDYVTVSGLVFRGAATGVHLLNPNYTELTGNRIEYCTSYGIDGQFSSIRYTTAKNNIIVQNKGAVAANFYSGGYPVYLEFSNNTIVTNGVNAFAIRSAGAAPRLFNNIFSVTGNALCIDAYDISAIARLDYNLYHHPGNGDLFEVFSARFGSVQELRASTGWETHGFEAEPMFADPAVGDLRLLSEAGRFDPSLGLSPVDPGAWVNDSVTSPGIDGGDPALGSGDETTPHGGIRNLGADGGTSEASRSPEWDRRLLFSSLGGQRTVSGVVRIDWRILGNGWLPGDRLVFSFSTDGGSTWSPLTWSGDASPSGYVFWDTRGLANGYGYRVRASLEGDGTVVGEASSLFAVANEGGGDWDLHVAPSGVDDGQHGTPEAPFRTLAYALGVAEGAPGANVNIRVAEGTYVENVTMEDKVNLLGGYDPVDWRRDLSEYDTILQGNGLAPVVTGANEAILEGFTITGGGGSNGAGIQCGSTSPIIRYCQVVNNTSTNFGGGISVGTGGQPIIFSCVVAGNQASFGDGIELNAASAIVRNCTVVNNGGHGIRWINGGLSTVSNCILWGNGDDLIGVTATHSVIEDSDSGTGVIHTNPQLDANWRLPLGSAAIDAGSNPETYQNWEDLDGRSRVLFGTVDIGAFEFSKPVIEIESPEGATLVSGQATVDFGGIIIGSQVSRVFVLRNVGSEPLSILQITPEGAHAEEVGPEPLAPTSLAPGEHVDLSVRFLPTGMGSRQASLRITSNDPDQNQFVVDLEATGLAPLVTVLGNEMPIQAGDTTPDLSDHTDFGEVFSVGAEVERTFLIRNDGTADLSLTNVSIAGNHQYDFTILESPGVAIPPNQSGTLRVGFDPGATGPRSATVIFDHNGFIGDTFEFAIGGVGIRAPQTITFANPGDQVVTATLNLSATGGASGNPVTFAVTDGPATIGGGNQLTFTGTGPVTITASQAGNANYDPAPDILHTFTVTKATATVNLSNLLQTYDGTPKSVSAATVPAGKTVDLTYNGSSTPPTAAGSYTVIGTIDDPIYQGSSTRTLTIGKATQTITGFSNPGNRLANTTVNLTATGGGSGNPVTFSASGPASINGSNVMSFTGTGSVTVRANQAGDSNYFAASEVAHTFTVSAASATVFLTNTIQTYNGSPRSVTVTTNPPGLSHSVVYVGQPGPPTNVGIYGVNVTITDPRYTGFGGADLVIQKASQTINFPTPPDTVETATMNLSATGGGSGNPVTFAISSGPAYFSAANQIRFHAPGTVTITASQAGNSNYNPATQIVRTFQVDDSTATVTISKLLQVADGSPRPVIVTTDPPGLDVTITYAGNSTPPSQSGRYAIVAMVNDALYDGSAQETLVLDDPGVLVGVPGGMLPPGSNLGPLNVPTFQIGRYETTWGFWKSVRDWGAANGYDLADRGAGCADGHPVRDVNWFDAVKWCNARTEWEGATRGISLTPVYRVGGAIYRSGEPDPATVVADESAGGYRLPTAEEWEFAARGGDDGTNYPYPGGYDPTPLAWFRDNSAGAACPISGGRGTWPVGEKSPNELGIYDLAGNIAEWTGSELPGVAVARYFRGGAWDLSASYCEISNLLDERVDRFSPILGFRVARSVAAALPVALDHDAVSWDSSGDQPWFAQTGTSHDGVDAAESGAVLPGEESRLETVFTGPGNLSFRWKAATPEGADVVELYLGDSGFEGSLTGSTDWELVTLEIPDGDWPVRWIFSRHPQSPVGPSRVWVDEVAFESATAPTVTTGAATYLDDATARFGGEVTDDGGRDLTARGVVYATTTGPTLETGTVLSAPTIGTGSFNVDAPVLVSTVYYARAFATNNLGTSYGDEVVYFSSNSDPVNFGDGIESLGLQIQPGSRSFFTFYLDRDRIVTLSSTSGSALRAILRDQSGNVLSRSDEGSNFELEPILERGSYVLEVFPDSGSTDIEDFQLTFDWTVEATRRTEVEVGPNPSSLTGVGVYDPIPQSVAIFSTKARPVSGYARVRNTGTMPDALTVRAGGRNVYFNVIWLGPAGNVTAGLLTGTYQTAPSSQGDFGELFRSSVVPNKKKLIRKKKKRTLILKKVLILPVSADSVGNPEHPNSNDSASIRVQTK